MLMGVSWVIYPILRPILEVASLGPLKHNRAFVARTSGSRQTLGDQTTNIHPPSLSFYSPNIIVTGNEVSDDFIYKVTLNSDLVFGFIYGR